MLAIVTSRSRAASDLLIALAIAMFFMPLDARAAQVDAAQFIVESRITLGEVTGRIDHLAYDVERHLVYVAELGNNAIGIVDLQAGRLLRTVDGFNAPQGVAYESKTDTVYVANSDGSVRMFAGADFTALGRIDLGSDADNMRVDSAAHEVFVGHGSAIAVIDARTRRRIADIPLAGHPESFQLHPDGDRIFVNVPDAGQIAVLSRRARRQLATWPTQPLRANFPLVLVPDRARVISVFRSPPRLQVRALVDGQMVAEVPVCGDADDVFADPVRGRVYVVCGEGAVLSLGIADFTELGRMATASGARTGLFIPELDRLVIAVRASGAMPASLWVLRPLP